MQPFFIVLIVVGLLVIFVWGIYNKLVILKNRIDEAWSSIDVQLKRRADLIPNLLETVKGYAKHEKEVFENVTKARSQLMNAKGVSEKEQADQQLTGALKSLFAVAEAYPELKASDNFQELQRELSDTEDKVAFARQFYNTTVLEYNNTVEVFPNSIFASMFGHKEKPFFEAGEAERKNVKVSF
jgi:LemA protein